ncbi:hypothetical protein Pcar_3487 [Syntrophotalea carbinolica DSM 2380]|uniref:Uncharacterized protein n=1 Tax=Syntrophotalea carbinolica (strain DSM 2380 / NBRC 103641 / GraBd1) TaxID=338963 RepID=J9UA44_SYNC1|nr:hypothetical protein Pcar_3487 [Syntrophotalea carbinolica DSM 2380]
MQMGQPSQTVSSYCLPPLQGLLLSQRFFIQPCSLTPTNFRFELSPPWCPHLIAPPEAEKKIP